MIQNQRNVAESKNSLLSVENLILARRSRRSRKKTIPDLMLFFTHDLRIYWVSFFYWLPITQLTLSRCIRSVQLFRWIKLANNLKIVFWYHMKFLYFKKFVLNQSKFFTILLILLFLYGFNVLLSLENIFMVQDLR